jgi:hypothetical protein
MKFIINTNPTKKLSIVYTSAAFEKNTSEQSKLMQNWLLAKHKSKTFQIVEEKKINHINY